MFGGVYKSLRSALIPKIFLGWHLQARLENTRLRNHHIHVPQQQTNYKMAITLAQIEKAHETLITFIPKGFRPRVAIIGGSGLAALEKAIEGERTEVGYEKIPGFPVSTGL